MPALPPVLPHVVVLGGGFAGLETAFLVNHRMRGEVNITLVSDRSDFTFRPNLVYVPFGVDPSKLEIPLGEATARQAITFVHDRAVEVAPATKRVVLASGTELTYDKLVLATGAAMAPEEVPGWPNTPAPSGQRRINSVCGTSSTRSLRTACPGAIGGCSS